MAGRCHSIVALGLITSVFIPINHASGYQTSETAVYSYDAYGRLIKVTRSGAVNDTVRDCYTYDKADNRSNVTVATSDCGPPSSFSISAASAIEGTAVAFTVSKSGAATGTLTVNYTTSGGTATSGTDFTATSGTLSFLAGDNLKTISVPTANDTAVESNETFAVTLSNASAGSTIGTAQGAGTIVDNDTPVNQPPVCAVHTMGPIPGNVSTTLTVTAAIVLSRCSDPDGGTLSVTSPGMPYTINVAPYTSYTRTHTVSDGQGGSTTMTINVTRS